MTLLLKHIIAAVSSATQKYSAEKYDTLIFKEGCRAGAEAMFEIADAEIDTIEEERDNLEAQTEHAPIVENLADQQKAEIAKRLVANLTIEQMEILEVNAFNMVKIHGGRYSIPADTIAPHSLQQLVDAQR